MHEHQLNLAQPIVTGIYIYAHGDSATRDGHALGPGQTGVAHHDFQYFTRTSIVKPRIGRVARIADAKAVKIGPVLADDLPNIIQDLAT